MTNNTVTKQMEAYSEVQQELQSTTSQGLLDYIFYLNVMNLDKKTNAKLLVDVDNAVVNMGASGKGYGFWWILYFT